MKNKSIFLKTFGIITLIVTANMLQAQQIPLYSQYYFNKFLYNPALTGASGETEASLFGRRQYVDIDGYQTAGITLNGSAKDGKIGLGVYYLNDENQLQQTNSVYGNYAYNVSFSDENMLSFGLALGVVNNRFNVSNIVTTDPDDPILRLLDRPAGAVLDASVGVNLKLGGFNFGFSLPQFLSNSQKFSDHYNSTVTYDLQNHLTVMTSYDIPVGDNLTIQPLVLFKNTANSPGQVDVNLIADWMNSGWLGAGYRDGYGMTFMGGLRIADAIRVGYSYDLSTGQYSTALGGSHELMIGAVLGNKKRSKEQEEMDAMREVQRLALEKKEKQQEKVIEDLEQRIEEVNNRPNSIDTVFVVSKAPEKPAVTIPGSDIPANEMVGEFLVIAGSFTEEKNATKYFNRLLNKGFSPFMYFERSSNKHYVHLGKYYFKQQARDFAKKTATGSVKLWVKTIK
jgi:type IX secretion system PorP/SprF family membrane protein